MKVKAVKEGVMVRLIVNGIPMFVSNVPVEVDENNTEVMEQVDTMVKLGWLEVVQEVVQEVRREEAKGEEVKARGKRGGGKIEGGE
jgi:hypothetical protein